MLTNLVDGLSVELATGMVAVVIGLYTSVGGLGATFYVSYFNRYVESYMYVFNLDTTIFSIYN